MKAQKILPWIIGILLAFIFFYIRDQILISKQKEVIELQNEALEKYRLLVKIYESK